MPGKRQYKLQVMGWASRSHNEGVNDRFVWLMRVRRQRT